MTGTKKVASTKKFSDEFIRKGVLLFSSPLSLKSRGASYVERYIYRLRPEDSLTAVYLNMSHRKVKWKSC